MSVARWLAVTVLVAVATAAALQAASGATTDQEPQRVNATAAAVSAFQHQIEAYLKVRENAQAQVPKLDETNDPQKISSHERELAEEIRRRRSDAEPGDIFVAEFRPVLLQLIRDDFARRSATDRKALVQELPAKLQLTVNMTYPTTLPLVTVPAKLLRALPELPDGLEYRILGRHLILRDVKANLIVDFVRDAVPTIPS